MKGLKHNVIEINHTENKDIDKILVFLKSGADSVAVANTRAEAEEILKGLEVKKPFKFTKKHLALTVFALVAICCTIFTFLAL